MNPFTDIDLPLPDRRDGKVRASFALPGGHRLFVTTDRLSAFDRVVAAVPYKGQVLNELAAWWFAHTDDIVANHVVSVPDPNALVAVEAAPLPVEVVVRGYITGVTTTSLWHFYARGDRAIYGHHFRDGLAKNTVLDHAIVTPTTKAEGGAHDEPLSCADVVERGLLDRGLWETVQDVALSLYDRGAEDRGVGRADTRRHEVRVRALPRRRSAVDRRSAHARLVALLGRVELRRTARGRPRAGEPRQGDRATRLRRPGYRGDGEPPSLPPTVWAEASARYIQAFETITATSFERGSYPVEPRLTANLIAEGVL